MCNICKYIVDLEYVITVYVITRVLLFKTKSSQIVAKREAANVCVEFVNFFFF